MFVQIMALGLKMGPAQESHVQIMVLGLKMGPPSHIFYKAIIGKTLKNLV